MFDDLRDECVALGQLAEREHAGAQGGRADRELRRRGHLAEPSHEEGIELMLGRYEGRHGFFRRWHKTRLGEQASWMLDYIDIALIADTAWRWAAS